MKSTAKQIHRIIAISLALFLAISIYACNFPQVLEPVNTTPTAQVPPTAVMPEGVEFPENVGEAPVEFTPVALQPTDAVATLEDTIEGSGHCGRNDTVYLMVLGIDKHAQADGIRMIKIDFNNATMHMTSIPRDFYVPIVGFEQFGINYGRINATFGYGEWFFGPDNGAKWVAENLEHNFGFKPDEQFVLYYDEIGKYIDAIGGITVTTEKAARDYWYNFPPGTYEMDGDTAVVFMRIRAFDTDIQRINRQTLVMEAILDKVRTGISPKMIYEVLTTLLKDKTTQSDLGLTDLYSFYCLSKEIKRADIHITAIPDTMFHPFTTETGAQVLIPHSEVVEFVREALGLTQ